MAGIVPVTQGVCPGSECGFGDSPRRFYEAVLALTAKTGRCPSALVGCPNTLPALKMEA